MLLFTSGFRKILKKYDKNLKTDAGARWRSEYVDNAMFYTTKDIDKLIQGNLSQVWYNFHSNIIKPGLNNLEIFLA